MRRAVIVFLLLVFFAGISGAATEEPEQFILADLLMNQHSVSPPLFTIQGRMTNNSGRDYATALFKLSVFDASGEFLGSGDYAVNNFKRRETVVFECYFEQYIKEAKSCIVRLDASY